MKKKKEVKQQKKKVREEKKLVMAWIDKKRYEDLVNIAEKNGVTVSALLRLATYEWINKNKRRELMKIS